MKNSYSSGDEINNLKRATLEVETYMDVFEYYQGLIAYSLTDAVAGVTGTISRKKTK